MPSKSLIYVSEGQGLRSVIQLIKFLPNARLANRRSGITGMLMYDGQRYLHIVEGRRKAVDSLMARIALDQRHTNIHVLCEISGGERWMSTFTAGLISAHDDAATVAELMHEGTIPTRDVPVMCLEIAIKADELP